MRPRRMMLAAFAFAAASAACTLLLDRSKEQCSTDADCVSHLGAGATCVESVCTGGSGADGGGDAQADGQGQDSGPDGCAPATTYDELLNACTNAQCVPFDNCDKLGICDGGYVGTIDPDAGTTSSTNPDSGAVVSCETTISGLGGTPIYVTGSSNFPAFLKLVAPLLATENKYVVWQQTNSCTGVDTVFNVDPAKHAIKEGPGKSTFYYDATGAQQPCILDNNQHDIDVGESDVFAAACAAKLGYTPDLGFSGAGEYFGPIQTMTYIVPPTSTQTVISAEAAQTVFGRGAVPDPNKLPWTDPAQFFTRADSTGTNQMLSRAMNVDPTKWWGVDKKTASGMASAIKSVPSDLADKTIGVLSTDTADQERGNIKILAFQAHGQKCGYWPDSTPFARDKQNVRDGHYPIWGYLHFYTRLQGGAPTAASGSFVLRFALPKLDQTLVEAISGSGNIPACAMNVSRDTEMGPLKPYDSPYDCDCFFDSKTKGPDKVDPACRTCTTAQDCPETRPACNYGYCEKH